MKERQRILRKKLDQALRRALAQAGAGEKAAETVNRICSRVLKFQESGAKPSRTALARLDLEFKLIEWSSNVKVTLEYMGNRTERRIAEAVGSRYPDLKTRSSQREAGKQVLDDACDASDQFADILLYACDWTAQEVWEREEPQDEAVRSLARGVAVDWKWATGRDLPEVLEYTELWEEDGGAPHPLWIALEAAQFDLGWGAVRVLANYALRNYPSGGGGVGMWKLDNISPKLSRKFDAEAEKRFTS